jgi:hypothetical protein
MGLWWAGISSFVFLRKSVTLTFKCVVIEPLAILAAFRGGWDVSLPRLVLKVGPYGLSAILDHSIPMPQISVMIIYHYSI